MFALNIFLRTGCDARHLTSEATEPSDREGRVRLDITVLLKRLILCVLKQLRVLLKEDIGMGTTGNSCVFTLHNN